MRTRVWVLVTILSIAAIVGACSFRTVKIEVSLDDDSDRDSGTIRQWSLEDEMIIRDSVRESSSDSDSISEAQ